MEVAVEGHIPCPVCLPVRTGIMRSPLHLCSVSLHTSALKTMSECRLQGALEVLWTTYNQPFGWRTWESYWGTLILCDSLQPWLVSKSQILQRLFGQSPAAYRGLWHCKYKLASYLFWFIFIILTMPDTVLDIFIYYVIFMYYLQQASTVRYYTDLITLLILKNHILYV